jgi:acetyltransferase-like isoleucine patch superfamily enzyme
MKRSVGSVVLHLKRADTPFFKSARRVLDVCLKATIPVPPLLRPTGRFVYEFRFFLPILAKRLKSLIYTTPLFSCRCESVGKHLQLCALPVVNGHTLLHIGDDVRCSGNFAVASGRFSDRPTLRIGDRVFIGHNVSITCNREVVIEDDVLIAANCRISDYDGHPSSLEKRIANDLPAPGDIRPVRIGKGAWIGSGALILKGVTIGAGSIVGAHSVVTHDVPPNCVAAGSPAIVVKRMVAADSPGFVKAAYAAA